MYTTCIDIHAKSNIKNSNEKSLHGFDKTFYCQSIFFSLRYGIIPRYIVRMYNITHIYMRIRKNVPIHNNIIVSR